jgi:hypothetical protein
MASNLSSFGLAEMLRCGLGIRRSTAGAESVEDATRNVCRFLYDELVADSGERACALVRCYKTHLFSKLRPADREFARLAMNGATPSETMRCLTLLATAGDEAKWNDRRRSKGHRVIPLATAEMVSQAPMIAQLLKQFGLDIGVLVRPAGEIVKDLEGKTYGVFHVAEAAGSPYIPAQDDFVQRYKIRSVVGCGSTLHGELYVLILFTKVPVTAASADRFRTIALDLKSALFPYDESLTFSKSG